VSGESGTIQLVKSRFDAAGFKTPRKDFVACAQSSGTVTLQILYANGLPSDPCPVSLLITSVRSAVNSAGATTQSIATRSLTKSPRSDQSTQVASSRRVVIQTRHRGFHELTFLSGSDKTEDFEYFLATHFDGTGKPSGCGFRVPATLRSPDVLEFDVDAASLDDDLRDLSLRIVRKPASAESPAKAQYVPVSIHVCSDVIVLVDRSAHMIKPTDCEGGPTKWDAVLRSVRLFDTLAGISLPDLATATDAFPEPNRTAVGTFWSDCSTELHLSGLIPAREIPLLDPAPPRPDTTSPIGAALIQAAQLFSPSPFRRRHIILLVGGTENAKGSSIEEALQRVPKPSEDPAAGVHVHVVAFGRAGELDEIPLQALARSHSGRYVTTATAHAPLSARALSLALSSLLGEFLPVEVVPSHESSFPLENGVERALFVAADPEHAGQPLRVVNDGTVAEPVPGSLPKNSVYAFAVATLPRSGLWKIKGAHAEQALFAVCEAALAFKANVSFLPGAPLTISAELAYQGQALSGAEVRVSIAHAGGSVAGALNAFIHAAGLVEAYEKAPAFWRDAAKHLASGLLLRGALLATSRFADDARRMHIGSSRLSELANEPGHYVKVEDIDQDGIYEFDFHARGQATQPFERSSHQSLVIDPVPDLQTSFIWYSKKECDGARTLWTATACFMATSGDPLGPGFAERVSLSYAEGAPEGSDEQPRVRDNWDGTYSTDVVSLDGEPPALVASVLGAPPRCAGGVVLNELPGTVRRVKITVVQVEVCRAGVSKHINAPEIVVAPNASFPRMQRRRIELAKPHVGIAQAVNTVVFDESVEADASLAILVGDAGFDYFDAFERDSFERQVRSLVDWAAEAKVDQVATCESFKVTYRVKVERLRSSGYSGFDDPSAQTG
jgi:hypothetical protein